ncbi:uncharacterized protein TRAVEDRAFT_49954 [Trametes versicolor FP-101664 SS1]|uniref:uncharacterized protein n=1 Tax=Trametes versicolor (strain FP-101664) TaxID=717944 RepID=UPI0004621E6B|nr:uncharacterized protein TRAVEDRAFT_49954 [Trametes versicolor FP-101664 SS1]EIW55464.1 hypothetical protein TRAVEDRAFT_49954 [Trametes versicolor FP-101664 SS1]
MDIKLHNMDMLSDRISLQFVGFERDLEIVRHGVRHLIGETQQAGEALADSVRESVVAHERQVAVAQATNDVVNALNGLVDKAHIEMENINGTASAMKESLLKDISGGWGVFTWSWLEAASVYSVKSLWNADVTLDMPAFRALFVFSRMLWSLLGLASSGLMVSTVEKTTPAKTLSVCSLTLTHLE